MMQCAGLGKLRPNILVLGFKHDWLTDEVSKVDDYINIVHDAFDANLSVAILRTPKGKISSLGLEWQLKIILSLFFNGILENS